MDTIKKSELWQRIRAARKRAGLTQQDVADNLNIDRTAIAQWEARNPSRRTRPDIARLESFAHMTRTPTWWLLSDEVDVLDPWPEVVAGGEVARPGPFVRAFWQEVQLRVREIRPDLWGGEVWSRPAPDWMLPLIPEAMTSDCAVRWVEVQRVDLTRIANLATSLLGLERLQHSMFRRKFLMVWRPTLDHQQFHTQAVQSYLHDVERIGASAKVLCERLDVHYVEVEHAPGAAHYLAKVL
jgi:transcriptional regulator with XRE-family HTH domain